MLGVTCQICAKRPATSHLTELDPDSGQRQELHLCGTCIQRLGLKLEAGPPPIATILDMNPDDGSSAKTKVPSSLGIPGIARDDDRCPQCGLAFSEFGSGKLFGCPHDYVHFADKVATLLRNYHGTTRHIGRVPGTVTAPPSEAATRRSLLDTALREAVAGEKYEDAARLRDELKRLGPGDA